MNVELEDAIHIARQYKIADETKIRNLKIKSEYNRLMMDGKHRRVDVIINLSKKYFLSFDSIERIIYIK